MRETQAAAPDRPRRGGKKDPQDLHKRFSALDRDPRTARLEKRLGQLGPRLAKNADAEDLPAINRQRVEAFYRCE